MFRYSPSTRGRDEHQRENAIIPSAQLTPAGLINGLSVTRILRRAIWKESRSNVERSIGATEERYLGQPSPRTGKRELQFIMADDRTEVLHRGGCYLPRDEDGRGQRPPRRARDSFVDPREVRAMQTRKSARGPRGTRRPSWVSNAPCGSRFIVLSVPVVRAVPNFERYIFERSRPVVNLNPIALRAKLPVRARRPIVGTLRGRVATCVIDDYVPWFKPRVPTPLIVSPVRRWFVKGFETSMCQRVSTARRIVLSLHRSLSRALLTSVTDAMGSACH